MSVGDLEKHLPVVLINRNYVVTSLNESARSMFGDVVGRKCFEVIYRFNKPCSEYNIACPIMSGEEAIDTVELELESFLRSYGKLPVGGLYWESVVNITNLSLLRAGTVDPTTGLHTKGFMLSLLTRLIHMKRRYGENFSILTVKIGNLDKVSAHYGSLTAEDCMRKAAECIRTSLRKSDFGIRYGRGEFIAILPKTTKEEAKGVADRIKEAMEGAKALVQLSIHVRVFEVPEKGMSEGKLLSTINQMLGEVE